MTFVGHSLGGGLAALASLVTNKRALTYNAAGLSIPTLIRYGVLYKSTSSINAFIVSNDPLHWIQSNMPYPKQTVQGNKTFLRDRTSSILPVNPANHSIDKVLELLDWSY